MEIDDELNELDRFKGNGSKVISFYLNIDGALFPRRQDLEPDLTAQLRSVEKSFLKNDNIKTEEKRSMAADLEKIDQYVRFELDREDKRGLVIFASIDQGLWKVVTLPVRVPSLVAVDTMPQVATLTSVIGQYDHYCTVVVDRRKARIFSVYMGEIEELSGVFEDNVPDQVKGGDWAALRQNKIAHHIEDHLVRHLKNVSKKTLAYYKARKFDHLLIGGSKEVIPKFKEMLQPYLKNRVGGEFVADPDGPINVVLKKSIECEEKFELERENDLIERVAGEGSDKKNSVIGLDDTVRAIERGQAYKLLIPQDVSIGGYLCSERHYVSEKEVKRCPVCRRDLRRENDVIGTVLGLAGANNVDVRFLRYHAEVADNQRIGALLRYAA